jgi:type II secretory pathway predicted ATPase ExeA
MLETGGGPVLLSGQSGAGKSWLLRRLAAASSFSWRWAFVDLSPAVDVEGFLRLTLHALGVETAPGRRVDRTRIDRFLNDRAIDGERWALCVEETHTAPLGVLEEIRVLSNHLGESGRLHGLILSGQNPLLRRLAGAKLAPLDARLVGRVHLGPVTVEELREWMRAASLGAAVDTGDVEWLHRQLAGNPLALHRALARRYAKPAPRVSPLPSVDETAPTPERPNARPAWNAPLLASTRPPIEESEGMIEVGWESPRDEDSEVALDVSASPVTSASTHTLAVPSPAGEEVVQDHYAALQAWTEWAKNQGRQPVAVDAIESESDEGPCEDDDDFEAAQTSRPAQAPGVWAETEQGFAPYGQLFTRLKRPTD